MDDRAAGIHHRVVVGVKGLRDNNLVPVVQDAVEDDLQRLAAPGGNEDVVRLKVHPQVVVIPLGGPDEHRHPWGFGVGQHWQSEVSDRLKVLRRRLNIRLTDIQVVDFFPRFLRRHGVGVEFSHWREAALFDLAGKSHGIILIFCGPCGAAPALFCHLDLPLPRP